MTFEEFEKQIIPAKREPTEIGYAGMMLYQSNGMAGEAGEAANEVKKLIRAGDPVGGSFDAVVEECGDQLFYMSRLLKMRGYRIEDAARALLAKLNGMRELSAHRPNDCPICQKRICGLM